MCTLFCPPSICLFLFCIFMVSAIHKAYPLKCKLWNIVFNATICYDEYCAKKTLFSSKQIVDVMNECSFTVVICLSVVNELVSHLPLQMLLYFNMFYFPCWWFSAVFMLEIKVSWWSTFSQTRSYSKNTKQIYCFPFSSTLLWCHTFMIQESWGLIGSSFIGLLWWPVLLHQWCWANICRQTVKSKERLFWWLKAIYVVLQCT